MSLTLQSWDIMKLGPAFAHASQASRVQFFYIEICSSLRIVKDEIDSKDCITTVDAVYEPARRGGCEKESPKSKRGLGNYTV